MLSNPLPGPHRGRERNTRENFGGRVGPGSKQAKSDGMGTRENGYRRRCSLSTLDNIIFLHVGYYESEMVMRAGSLRNLTKYRHRKVIMVLAVKNSALKTATNVLLGVVTQCMWGSGKLTSSAQSWTRTYRTRSATNLGGSDCQRSCYRK